MISYANILKFIGGTDTNTNKNLSSANYTFTSASVSVPVGTYVTRTYAVPLSEATRLYQLLVNVSLDGGRYYLLPNPPRRYGGTGQRAVIVMATSSGSSINLVVYLVNQNPSASETFPSFTVSVSRRDFIDEI